MIPDLDTAKLVGFDFETSGELPEYALQPWRWQPTFRLGGSWLTSMSVIRQDAAGGLVPDGSKLFPTKDDVEAFLTRAVAEGWTVAGWNIVFDISWCFALGLGKLAHQVKWLDAMLLWKHLEIEPEYEFQSQRHKKKSYRLKPDGIERWLPSLAGYNDDVDFHSQEPSELEKLQKYNDRDSVATWIIAIKMVWPELTERQRQAALIEAECLSMVAEANCTGMLVDTVACHELGAWLDDTAATMLAQLEPHGVTEKVVRSPKQLSALIFDGWRLPVLKINTSKTTGNESRSTDKEVLHELAFIDVRAKHIKQYREALNNKGKFSTSILDSVEYNGDGRTRPAAIVFGTYSGRLTYSSKQGKNKDERQTGFAIHQEKREKIFREVIIPPPGFTLVEFDASGQEYRWMAVASGDQTMLNLCQPGEDPHSYMGSRIVGGDYRDIIARVAADEKMAKDTRQLGKFGNLSCQYRIGAKTLRTRARVQHEMPMELPEAQRLLATYKQTYPGVPSYWAAQVALTKNTGYVETLAGRRVSVTGNWDGEYGWSMGSTAINYRIQGTGADQKYLAMMVIKDYVTSIGGSFGWDLHDGIYLYIPTPIVPQAVVALKHMLDNLPYQRAWGITPPIPLPWDCKTGFSWGGLKEWKF